MAHRWQLIPAVVVSVLFFDLPQAIAAETAESDSPLEFILKDRNRDRQENSALGILNTFGTSGFWQGQGGTQSIVLPGLKTDSGVSTDRGRLAGYVCNHWVRTGRSENPSFCSVWPGYEKKINAAAEVMGFPAPLLACLYLKESQYHSTVCSPVGACGLSQFMPATAREVEGAMSRDPKLQSAWQEFTSKVGGGDEKFTKASIRGERGQADLDAQIFATSVYFRKYYSAFEDDWSAILRDDPSKKTLYLQSLLAGYNAGPLRFDRMTRRVKRLPKGQTTMDLSFLPKETQTYIDRITRCMTEPSPSPGKAHCRGVGAGQTCDNTLVSSL